LNGAAGMGMGGVATPKSVLERTGQRHQWRQGQEDKL